MPNTVVERTLGLGLGLGREKGKKMSEKQMCLIAHREFYKMMFRSTKK
jgi:sortase (surface protein transpeptidase)